MRLICVSVVLCAVLLSVPPANAESLNEAGTDENNPLTPVVKVDGGVRQTITAVHPGPSPKQTEKSEAWWMTFSGLVLLLISVGAFFVPKAFMYGRRSWFWRDLIGENATAIMIRIISCIVGVAGALIMLAGIFIFMDR